MNPKKWSDLTNDGNKCKDFDGATDLLIIRTRRRRKKWIPVKFNNLFDFSSCSSLLLFEYQDQVEIRCFFFSTKPGLISSDEHAYVKWSICKYNIDSHLNLITVSYLKSLLEHVTIHNVYNLLIITKEDLITIINRNNRSDHHIVSLFNLPVHHIIWQSNLFQQKWVLLKALDI